VIPGVIAWLLIVLVEAIVTMGHGAAARTSGTVTTVLLVSTLPWAITVPLPRFAGAIGWLLVLVTTTSFAGAGMGPRTGWPLGALHSDVLPSLGVLLFPMGLIGRDVGSALMLVAPALLLGGLAMGAAMAWIYRADFALESAQ
jgi:hypothetical protein